MENADVIDYFLFRMILSLSPMIMNDNSSLDVIYTIIFHVNWVKC